MPDSHGVGENGSANRIAEGRITAVQPERERLYPLAVAAEIALDGVAVLSRRGRFMFANRAYARMHGIRRAADLAGRSWRQMYPREEHGRLEPYLEPGRRKTGGRECVVEALRGDEMRFPQQIVVRALPDDRVVLVARDLTDWRQHAEQLQRMQRLEAVGRFAGAIAHDFNNILATLKSYAHLLLDGSSNAVDAVARLREILDAADRGAALSQRLVRYSRGEVVVPAILDLNEVVASVEPMLRRLMGSGVKLETRLDPRLPRVRADDTQLDQVLMNLAVNAKDAMPNGGTFRLETEVACFDPDELRARSLDPGLGAWVVVRVSDTGTGIDPSIRERIFEPYFTTKGPDSGTGLGLATVSGIVKEAGGTIAVESELGRGTTFVIHLPAVE